MISFLSLKAETEKVFNDKQKGLLPEPDYSEEEMFHQSFMNNPIRPLIPPEEMYYSHHRQKHGQNQWNQGRGAFRGHNRGQQDRGHQFKVPRGRGRGHYRTFSDTQPQEINNQNHQFFRDDFQDINWNDNRFHWQRKEGRGGHQDEDRWSNYVRDRNRGNRRGSYDNSFRIPDTRPDFPQRSQQNWDGSDRQEKPERGRGILRDRSAPRRSMSCDNISPESNSSSDSGLKRRRDYDDPSVAQPGKSRRYVSPDNYMSSSSGYQSGKASSQLSTRGNQRGRTRSTSRERPMTMRDFDSESEVRSTRSVTWSDQQHSLSSSESGRDDTARNSRANNHQNSRFGPDFADESEMAPRRSSRGKESQVSGFTRSERIIDADRDTDTAPSGRSRLDRQRQSPVETVLPDSTSDLEEEKKMSKRKQKQLEKMRNKSPHGGQRLMESGDKTGDNTDSILEKAEQLCKKLRTEREQAKTKKKQEEKMKKMEKEMEIDKRLETLAEKNKSNIRGVLDSSAMSSAQTLESVPTKLTYLDSHLSASASENMDSLSSSDTASSVRMAPSSKKLQAEKPYLSQKDKPESKDISQRIAKTKADIDAIRAKIESSVHGDMPEKAVSAATPESPTAALSVARFTDKSALVKMVNSPRTTKEKLSLAQMLREHAKSQKKLSLPRFNLRYSDLCSASGDKGDQYTNINVDRLDTNSILEIANLIESDIKPDIGYLEQLLDNASVENVELDSAVLSNLGIMTSPVSNSLRPSSPLRPSPLTVRSTTPVKTSVANEDTFSSQLDTRPSEGKIMPGVRYLSQSDVQKDSRDIPARTMTDTSESRDRLARGTSPIVTKQSTVSIHDKWPVSHTQTSETATFSFSSLSSSSSAPSHFEIKEEKLDSGYDMALAGTPGSRGSSPTRLGRDHEEQLREVIEASRYSPVQRSVHTRNLYRDEIPSRENKPGTSESNNNNTSSQRTGVDFKSPTSASDSTSQKVSRILSSVPAPDFEVPRSRLSEKTRSSQGQGEGQTAAPVFSMARMASEGEFYASCTFFKSKLTLI